jgi:predicted ArsR family transcriptional regulator
LRKINHTKMAKTIAVLHNGPTTASRLASEAGVHLVTAQSWLRELRQQGVVHITQWQQDSLGRDSIPVYALGKGDDLPRRRTTRSETMKRYRERKRGLDVSA